MPFPPNWGKFQTNLLRLSHPVLPSLHPEQARRREKKKESGLGDDLKTTPRGCSPCLKDTRPHYQIFTKKLYPITVQREAVLVRKGLWKWFQSICTAVHWISLSFSLVWHWRRKQRKKKHLHLPPIQFSDYMGQYRIFLHLPDASCKSFNALGSWERICICMMGLHNK